MIVIIDMDDVVTDTSEYLYKKLRNKYPHIKEFQVQRTHFDIKDEYSPENLKKVQGVLYSSEFQASIPPVKGALKAILQISQRGHDIVFCSAPHAYYESCILQKYKWLEGHLGRPFARKLILTDDKTLVIGDLLIDDKPEITGLRSPSWKHILFTASYNQHVCDKRRMNSWAEWKKVLTEL